MANVRKVNRLLTTDVTVNRQVFDLVRATNELSDMALGRGRLIEDIALVDAITTKIAHGLDRRLQGWIVVDLTGPVTTGRIERVLDVAADTTKYLWLKATGWGATITIAVWVF